MPRFAASHLGLLCLPTSHKKDESYIWFKSNLARNPDDRFSQKEAHMEWDNGNSGTSGKAILNLAICNKASIKQLFQEPGFESDSSLSSTGPILRNRVKEK